MKNDFLSLDETLNLTVLEKNAHLNSLFSNQETQELGKSSFMSSGNRFNFDETEQNTSQAIDFNSLFTKSASEPYFDPTNLPSMEEAVYPDLSSFTEINFANDAGYSVNMPDAIAVFTAPELEFTALPFVEPSFIPIAAEIEIPFNFDDLITKSATLDERIIATTGSEIQNLTWEMQISDSSFGAGQSTGSDDGFLNEAFNLTGFDQGTSLGLEITYFQ